jgi:protein O-GlcNAc transferase
MRDDEGKDRELLVSEQLNLAIEYYRGAQLQAAETCLRKVVTWQPDSPDGWNLLGVVAAQQKQYLTARECIQRAIAINPRTASFHSNLGNVYLEQQDFKQAIGCYLQAIHLNPQDTDTQKKLTIGCEKLLDLGIEHHRSGRREEAADCYQGVLKGQPDRADAWHLWGVIASEQDDFSLAIKRINRAIAIHPNAVSFYNNLANIYLRQQQFEQAIATGERSIQLKPDDPAIHALVGMAYEDLRWFGKAIGYYQASLQLQPDNPDVRCRLGRLFKAQGRIPEAIECYRQGLSHESTHSLAYINLLTTWNYSSETDPAEIFAEYQKWAQIYPAPLGKLIQPLDRDRHPDRKLRIGYVSGDFYAHAVAFFFAPLLFAHDRSQFEIICYANNRHQDATTQRLQASADGWREIHTLKDGEVADLIRQDRIDILVDLSGHTKNNRLPVFAQKPAPIQATYIGYPNTTGIGTIDYRIVDAKTDPMGQTEHLHTEELIRLPDSFLCYQPLAEAPEIAPPPVLHSQQITFGSFNKLAKVSPESIAYWSEILKAVPHSRLLIKAKPLVDPDTRDYIYQQFYHHEIRPERLELLGWLPDPSQHLDIYNRVDIALDTFPYNGTTTTCEAMWMGVPVVTLGGKTHVSRVGLSLLSSVGLGELIATSPQEYIQTAIDLADNLERLQQLRSTLRDRMQKSPLTNGKLITRSLEDAYRQIWQKWCASAESLDRQNRRHLSTIDRPKFILIKAWGYGFWSDIDHVLGQLLIAELTGRIPIVHWGDNSLYRDPEDDNGFENYFEPVSPYTIEDLVGQSYTFYPSKWSADNLKSNNLNKWRGEESRLSGAVLLSRTEDVVVSDFHSYVEDLRLWIDPLHSLGDKSTQEIYRYLYQKYLKLKPEIERDIEQFWSENLADRPTLSVHVRGSDKKKESSILDRVNQEYHQSIARYLEIIPNALIFLLTDEVSKLEEYQQKYGERLRYTKANRTSTDLGIHYQKQASARQMGLEIIRDTYLAARCNYFIGNGHSNVSTTVLHLKEWAEDRYILLAGNRLLRNSKDRPDRNPGNPETLFIQTSEISDRIEARLKLGIEHHQAGRPIAAEACYRQTIQWQPENADAWHLLGVFAAEKQQYPIAIERINRAIDLSPNAPLFHTNLGKALQQEGRLAEAVAAHQRALQIDPHYADAYSNLGNTLNRQGKTAEAIACYQQALQLNPNLLEACNNLGNIFNTQGKLEQAIGYYQQALKLNPNLVEAHNNLGNAFKTQGKLEQAIACYQQTLKLNPNYAQTHYNLGNTFHLQSKLAAAVASYQQALKLKPNYAEVYNNLGNTLNLQGKLTEAIASYHQALKLKPNYAEVYSNLGTAFLEQGKLKEAIAYFQRAIEIAPHWETAQDNAIGCLTESAEVPTLSEAGWGWIASSWAIPPQVN